jgi:hypothetical protein
MRKFYCFLALLVFSSTSHAVCTVACCTVSSGVITNVNDSICYTQPDYYSIKLLKLYLCTSEPSGPTSSSAADLDSCQILADGGTSGITVTLEGMSSTTLSGGTYSRVPDGVYTHAYIKLSNVISLKMDKELANSSVGTTGGTGNYCATVTGSGDEKQNGGSSVCSSSDDLTAGIWTSTFTSMSGGAGDLYEVSLVDINNEGIAMNIYLTDSDSKLITLGDRDSTNYIEATQSLVSPQVVEEQKLKSVNIAIGISQGIGVWDPTSGATSGIEFSPGPFVTSITLTNY